ncbi:archease [Streptomyces sp. NPDC057696]|uniref:archease n=1 Tax=Streptomyces sp. NPDC057696 TaxID=3346218 RepID=UPI00368104A7
MSARGDSVCRPGRLPRGGVQDDSGGGMVCGPEDMASGCASGMAERRRPWTVGNPRGAALHEWPPGCVTHRGSAGGGAWSPTAVGCVGEAVRAVVAGFTDTSGAAVVRDRVHAVTAELDEDLPVSLLEEVSYRMDADDEIPLDARVGRSGPPQTTGACRSASGWPDAGTAVAVGAVPKTVSLHGLQSRDDPGGWTCRVTLDV